MKKNFRKLIAIVLIFALMTTTVTAKKDVTLTSFEIEGHQVTKINENINFVRYQVDIEGYTGILKLDKRDYDFKLIIKGKGVIKEYDTKIRELNGEYIDLDIIGKNNDIYTIQKDFNSIEPSAILPIIYIIGEILFEACVAIGATYIISEQAYVLVTEVASKLKNEDYDLYQAQLVAVYSGVNQLVVGPGIDEVTAIALLAADTLHTGSVYAKDQATALEFAIACGGIVTDRPMPEYSNKPHGLFTGPPYQNWHYHAKLNPKSHIFFSK